MSRRRTCRPFSRSRPLRDAALQQLLPVAGKVAALGDDADERGVRAEAERVVDGADDRDAVLGLPGCASESSIATTSSRR